MEKRCSGPCGERKPLEAFAIRSRSRDGRQNYCLECAKIYRKLHRRDPKNQRAQLLKHRYDLTVEEWDRMLIEQTGRCALCGVPMQRPHVDHSHDTRDVRGLLCLPCNTMLGHVERLGLPRIEQYLDRD